MLWPILRHCFMTASSTGTEYVRAWDASKYGLGPYFFFDELVQVVPAMNTHGQLRVMFMANTWVTNKMSKHIDLCCHTIWGYNNNASIKLEYINAKRIVHTL